jgi:anhydro-N-acetylmuramic acid kinase
MQRQPMMAIGLMSGTSLDGIDAAIVSTDGETVAAVGASATYPYDNAFRDRLRGLLGREPVPGDGPLIGELTRLHADAVSALLQTAGIAAAAIDVIGFHGQTVLHEPARRRTVQLGFGQVLADLTAIPVVEDFRSADVAAGGQGAPLVPLFHAALADRLVRPLAILNIGGVANVTWIGEGDPLASGSLLAFDCGPGNALIDDWVRFKTGQAMDEGGRLAGAGICDEGRVGRWLKHQYFRLSPPKSLDRDVFASWLAEIAGMNAADGAATLALLTARSVAAACRFFPATPRRWLVCGGGRHNSALMAMLARALAAPVEAVEQVGWQGDVLEAQAFAFLAVRSLRGLPLSVPGTTGVPAPQTGGVLRRPVR